MIFIALLISCLFASSNPVCSNTSANISTNIKPAYVAAGLCPIIGIVLVFIMTGMNKGKTGNAENKIPDHKEGHQETPEMAFTTPPTASVPPVRVVTPPPTTPPPTTSIPARVVIPPPAAVPPTTSTPARVVTPPPPLPPTTSIPARVVTPPPALPPPATPPPSEQQRVQQNIDAWTQRTQELMNQHNARQSVIRVSEEIKSKLERIHTYQDLIRKTRVDIVQMGQILKKAQCLYNEIQQLEAKVPKGIEGCEGVYQAISYILLRAKLNLDCFKSIVEDAKEEISRLNRIQHLS